MITSPESVTRDHSHTLHQSSQPKVGASTGWKFHDLMSGGEQYLEAGGHWCWTLTSHYPALQTGVGTPDTSTEQPDRSIHTQGWLRGGGSQGSQLPPLKTSWAFYSVAWSLHLTDHNWVWNKEMKCTWDWDKYISRQDKQWVSLIWIWVALFSS